MRNPRARHPRREDQAAVSGERLIRKYGNRRLYDTRSSRYVTLANLVEVFAAAEPVRVIDAVTGEDLTKRVLAQTILFEESRRRTQILPIELLRTLLRKRTGRQRRPHTIERQRDVDRHELDEFNRRLRALERHVHR